jgi:hypothetical protein
MDLMKQPLNRPLSLSVFDRLMGHVGKVLAIEIGVDRFLITSLIVKQR